MPRTIVKDVTERKVQNDSVLIDGRRSARRVSRKLDASRSRGRRARRLHLLVFKGRDMPLLDTFSSLASKCECADS